MDELKIFKTNIRKKPGLLTSTSREPFDPGDGFHDEVFGDGLTVIDHESTPQRSKGYVFGDRGTRYVAPSDNGISSAEVAYRKVLSRPGFRPKTAEISNGSVSISAQQEVHDANEAKFNISLSQELKEYGYSPKKASELGRKLAELVKEGIITKNAEIRIWNNLLEQVDSQYRSPSEKVKEYIATVDKEELLTDIVIEMKIQEFLVDEKANNIDNQKEVWAEIKKDLKKRRDAFLREKRRKAEEFKQKQSEIVRKGKDQMLIKTKKIDSLIEVLSTGLLSKINTKKIASRQVLDGFLNRLEIDLFLKLTALSKKTNFNFLSDSDISYIKSKIISFIREKTISGMEVPKYIGVDKQLLITHEPELKEEVPPEPDNSFFLARKSPPPA